MIAPLALLVYRVIMADRQIDFVSQLASALGVTVKENKPMGHLDSFAEDVNETVAGLNKQFEDLNERKQKLKERGGEIAGRWAQHFDSQEASLTAAEAALNRISNVPISAVPSPKPQDQVLSGVKKDG
jgi:hypothetical protein